LIDDVFKRRVGKMLLTTIGWRDEKVGRAKENVKKVSAPPPKLDLYGVGYEVRLKEERLERSDSSIPPFSLKQRIFSTSLRSSLSLCSSRILLQHNN